MYKIGNYNSKHINNNITGTEYNSTTTTSNNRTYYMMIQLQIYRSVACGARVPEGQEGLWPFAGGLQVHHLLLLVFVLSQKMQWVVQNAVLKWVKSYILRKIAKYNFIFFFSVKASSC